MELAKKILYHHKNPIVKIDLPGNKLFLKPCTSEGFTSESQQKFEDVLRYIKSERRCGRSRAKWSQKNELAKVAKMLKSLLHNFGYQDKSGISLYPEETLFLMETDSTFLPDQYRISAMLLWWMPSVKKVITEKVGPSLTLSGNWQQTNVQKMRHYVDITLEVSDSNEIPVTVQEGYNLLFYHNCSLIKYQVYKKLVLLGYKVVRYQEIIRRNRKNEKIGDVVNNKTINRKRNNLDGDNFVAKKMREDIDKSNKQSDIECCNADCNVAKKIEMEYVQNIFKNMHNTKPKECEFNTETNGVPDYCVFLPNNKSRCKYDFDLFICEGSVLQKIQQESSTPSIFALCVNDNVSFYRCTNVTVPFL